MATAEVKGLKCCSAVFLWSQGKSKDPVFSRRRPFGGDRSQRS